MFDDEKVEQEVAPVQDQSIFGQDGLTAQPDTPAAPEQQAPVETEQQKNFKAMRIRNAQLERERDEALARLQNMQKPEPMVQDDDDEDDIGVAPDDIVEGKHISKLNKQLKNMRKQLDAYAQQSSTMSAETRLKMQYPDIDQVVNTENIQMLNQLHPELANTLKANPDLYSKAVAAYTMIKKLGISNDDVQAQERETVQKNIAKPRPLASVSPQQGDSPLSRANVYANGLTADLKKQLYKEMLEASRSR